MKVFIRESLFLVEYSEGIDGKIELLELLFKSDDKETPGYAYEINIEEANTGYSNLSFKIPSYIMQEADGVFNKVRNPLLLNINSLSRVRYKREVYYTGAESVTVVYPDPTGQSMGIPTTYQPGQEILDQAYSMDYVIEPFDKTRQELQTVMTFTAIDYPRFTLSKKKVGLMMDANTIAPTPRAGESNLSIMSDGHPKTIAGTVAYVPVTTTVRNALINGSAAPNNLEDWNNIQKWDFNVTQYYPFTDGQIAKIKSYAQNWWPYGVTHTSFVWEVAESARFEGIEYTKGDFITLSFSDTWIDDNGGDGTLSRATATWLLFPKPLAYMGPNNAKNYLSYVLYDTMWKVKNVDIVKKEIGLPNGGFETSDETATITLSGSNCYNAIVEIAKKFQLYPIFDCQNHTVSLRVAVGKDESLTYRFGETLRSNGANIDGSKVITKLYVTGSTDAQGSEKINIGSANRQYVDGTNPDNKVPWNPNDQAYIQKRSPYGTNYILNFKYLYDRGSMTKDQILDLYAKTQEIHNINLHFYGQYSQQYADASLAYHNARNAYDLASTTWESKLHAMMSEYWISENQPTLGTRYAFLQKPRDVIGNVDDYYITLSPNGYTYVNLSVGGGKAVSRKVDDTYVAYVFTSKANADAAVSNTTFRNSLKEGDPFFLTNAGETHNYYWNGKALVIDPGDKVDVEKMFTVAETGGNIRVNIAVHNNSSANSKGIGLLEQAVDSVSNATWWPYTNWPIAAKVPMTTNMAATNSSAVKDVSAAVYTYNRYVVDWTTYRQKAEALKKEVTRTRLVMDNLEAILKKHEADIAAREKAIQELYGDYLIEGSFNNDQQPYVNLLLNDGLAASEKYCVPQVTYKLTVMDTTGLIEYRSLLNETYNDIVYSLASIGQIIPRAGDYVGIIDEELGMYDVPGLIVKINRKLDNPMNNDIQIDTAYTDADELVGNIITATNTVLNNSDIYARTAMLNADGTIDPDSILNSLSKPNGQLSLVGTFGNSVLDSTGLKVTDPNNKMRGMFYSGSGVYTTDSGGIGWRGIITNDGINGNYINAGTIDTEKLSITNGRHKKVILDARGLAVKTDATRDYTIGGNWDNVSAFLGVDENNVGRVMIKGQIETISGSSIGGFDADGNAIRIKSAGLSSMSDIAFWAGYNNAPDATATTAWKNATPFWVAYDGTVRATKLTLSGSSSAGGWNVSDNAIAKGSVTISSNNSSNQNHAINIKLGAVDQFYVNFEGKLYAKNADIEGRIVAKSGEIGGNLIVDGSITVGKINVPSMANQITTGWLADNAITGVKIENNAISAGKIAANAVVAGKIDAGAISAREIQAGAINANHIQAGSINASKVAADIITTTNFSAQNINANNITTGTLSGRTINGGSISIGGGTFAVSSSGALTSTSATISGTLNAGVGSKIGNLEVRSDRLTFDGASIIRTESAGGSDFDEIDIRVVLGETFRNHTVYKGPPNSMNLVDTFMSTRSGGGSWYKGTSAIININGTDYRFINGMLVSMNPM